MGMGENDVLPEEGASLDVKQATHDAVEKHAETNGPYRKVL